MLTLKSLYLPSAVRYRYCSMTHAEQADQIVTDSLGFCDRVTIVQEKCIQSLLITVPFLGSPRPMALRGRLKFLTVLKRRNQPYKTDKSF